MLKRIVILLLLFVTLSSFANTMAQDTVIEDPEWAAGHWQYREDALEDYTILPQKTGESYFVRFECFDPTNNQTYEILMTPVGTFDINYVSNWDETTHWLSEQPELFRGDNLSQNLSEEEVREFYLSLHCPEEQITMDEEGVIIVHEYQIIAIPKPEEGTLRIQVQLEGSDPSVITFNQDDGWRVFGFAGSYTVFAEDFSYALIGLPERDWFADMDREAIDDMFEHYGKTSSWRTQEGDPAFALVLFENNAQ